LRYRWLSLSILLVAFVGGAAWIAVSQLLAPAQQRIGNSPADLQARVVEFPSASGSTIHGWLSLAPAGNGTILLLHGVRSNRLAMVSRAEFLHHAGYSVMLIDMQAHGESIGKQITFGYLESRDVSAALEILRKQRPTDRIGIIGVSMGAAATVLAKDRPDVVAIVLESMYPTIDQALSDRLRLHLGALGPALAPALKLQFEPRLGITVQQLRPIDHISQLNVPVLIISGTKDEHTTSQETQALFDAATQPKQLWLVHDAAHVDMHHFARASTKRASSTTSPPIYAPKVSTVAPRSAEHPGFTRILSVTGVPSLLLRRLPRRRRGLEGVPKLNRHSNSAR
jgi:uncharacterized protein